MRIAVALAALALGMWPATLAAGQPDPPKDKDSDTPLDAEFVKVAAASNMAVHVAARFGTTRSKKVPVTLFAQRVTADQAKASEELIKLAVKKKIQLPKAIDKKDTDANVKMLSHEGAKFDRAFVERMVNDRKLAITLYENQAKNGKDKDLKAYGKTPARLPRAPQDSRGVDRQARWGWQEGLVAESKKDSPATTVESPRAGSGHL